MSYEKLSVTLTTNSAGSVTATIPGATDINITGILLAVQYVKVDYADTFDLVVDVETSAFPVWTQSNITASAIVAPRMATHDVLGAASLFAGGGEPVEDYIPLVADKVQFAVTNAGDSKSGQFVIFWRSER